ncbi:Ig-like domain-containing protein [Thalassovita sp.]|uniref:Ig-like domain-containing protein n=1 Tax=Thalassovita sp. TaxID=1979401 RepID=UPI0029DE698E|nr:Ig-like domain-containing protein [Thalassovita sp.]
MSATSCGPVDFVFLQDLSGSYTDDLPILKAQVPNLIAATEGGGADIDFAVASFIDKPTGAFGAAGDYVYQTHLGLSTDNASVISTINGLATRSGADAPEAQLEALLQTALREGELGYRAGSTRVVMLSTDSTYHVAGDFAGVPANNLDTVLDGSPAGTGEDYPTIAGLRDALLAANIFPVFSVTATVRADYEALVDQLGFGAVVTMTSDSENFSDAVRTALGLACGIVTHQGTDLDDSIDGSEDEDGIFGGLGDDTIHGLGSDDVVDGGAGADECHGDDGRDEVRGGSGNDDLYGETEDDTLSGGLGDDTLTGGTGADRFVINKGDGIDVITDFEDGIDLLDLSSWDKTEAASAVIGATQTAGGDVRVTFVDGSSVRIVGLNLANFDLTDVILASTNAAPIVLDDSATTVGTDPVIVNALLNDTDIEGDPISITSVGAASHGVAELLADGTLRYTADLGFVGADSFLYVVSDGALTSSARVHVTVERDLTGDDGDNYLVGGASAELLEGFDGHDTLLGNGGDDTLDGGAGDDSLRGGDGRDSILGGDGADVIIGGAAAVPEGGDNDTLDGGAGDDTIDGGDSDDVIFGGSGDDSLLGGGENDAISGGSGADVLIGGAGHDELKGGSGDDTLDGGSGDDQMDGGGGHDVYRIGAADGEDIIEEDANPATSVDTILFGPGLVFADVGLANVLGDLVLTLASGATVTVKGQYDDASKAIEFLQFDDGGIFDVLSGTYTAPGPTQGNDTLLGTAGGDTIDALGGRDRVDGGGGDDSLLGGAGRDTLIGGLGDDTITGSGGSDRLFGNAGLDVLLGGGGRDKVIGGSGRDNLNGGSSDDLLKGGTGNDTLIGGTGDDTLIGGAGADQFIFAEACGSDLIKGYETGIDTLQVTAALWNGVLDQARLDALADTSGPDLVLHFDGGESVTLQGIGSTVGLLDDLVMV